MQKSDYRHIQCKGNCYYCTDIIKFSDDPRRYDSKKPPKMIINYAGRKDAKRRIKQKSYKTAIFLKTQIPIPI